MADDRTKRQLARGQADAKAAAATKGGASNKQAKVKDTSEGTSATKSSKAQDGVAAAQGKGATAQAKTTTRTGPTSTDIRRSYMKSLLGDYLGKHRGGAAIKPKK